MKKIRTLKIIKKISRLSLVSYLLFCILLGNIPAFILFFYFPQIRSPVFASGTNGSEIIFISKAFQLDQNHNITADIYDQVQAKDTKWASLTDGQYVRVTFNEILNNTNDNTIYAKPINPHQSSSIEVYPVYTDKDGKSTEGPLVATFPTIDHEGTYKVLLTILPVPTDVFDYKIKGNININYIVDPTSWLTGWSYRKKVTISNTNVDADLSNFPLLVKIAETGGGSTNIGYNVSDTTNGYDIRFTDSDGTTLLSYERESFSIASSNLTAIFWVKVPTVKHLTTTDFYIYYTNSAQSGSDWTTTTGSGNCSSVTQAQCTWKEGSSQNFKAVWHLKETGTNPTIYDSTSNTNTSTTQTWTPTTGAIDGGGGDDGSKWVEFNANTVFLTATSAHTTSFWVNVTSYSSPAYPTPINIKTNIDNYSVYLSNTGSYEGISASQVGTAGWRASGTSAALVGAWNYVTAVFDGVDRTQQSSWKIYLNGVSKSLTTGGSWTTLAANRLYTDDTTPADTLNGTLDEMRVAQTARPAEWVKFEYYNQSPSSSNNELTFNTQETGNSAPTAPTVLYANESATGAQSGVANPVAVGSATPKFSAIYNDPDTGDIATKYEIIAYSDAGCSASVWDSGSGGTSMTNCTQGNRCGDITFGGTPLVFDGSKYYWKIRYWDTAGVAGTFSGCTDNFTILGPDNQMRHGDYFFNNTTRGVFTW